MSDLKACDPEVFEYGELICIVDMPKHEAEAICASKRSETGDRYDWHYSGGRVVMKKLPADWVKPETVESLKQQIAELEAKLAAAEADAEKLLVLRRLVAALDKHRSIPCSGETSCGYSECDLVMHNHLICKTKEARDDLQSAIDAARSAK